MNPTTPGAGIKFDAGKHRFSLLPVGPLRQLVAVLELGASKYGVENWKQLDNPRDRFFNAACRHLWAWWGGEKLDPESGLPHLAHVACNVFFLMWFDDQPKEQP